MEKGLNIVSLTHLAPRRAQLLDLCIRSFLKNTTIPEGNLQWTIYCNSYDDEFKHVLRDLQADSHGRINILPVYGDRNEGLGAGVNKCNELSAGFEYTLFLEADWLCMEPEESGQPRNWLVSAINLLDEESDVDAVYLRRYFCDIDSRQTGLHSHYKNLVRPVSEREGLRYFVSDFRSYTNNPLVRRNSSFYNKGIFPLVEQYATSGIPMEHKGSEKWGLCEIEAERRMEREGIDLRMAVLNWGLFVHIENATLDGYSVRLVNEGCRKDPTARGYTGCKWGYLRMSDHFCARCQKGYAPHELDLVFKDEGYFLQEIEKAKEAGAPRQDIEAILNKWNADPMRPVSEIVEI